jgi:DNA-binding transcriptional MerR regulator
MTNDARTPEPMLVDRREAARLLGVSAGTIDNLRKRGAIPSVKIATRRLYDVGDLRRFVETRKTAATGGTP